jgi:putative membrane protein
MNKPIATWSKNDKNARILIFGFSIFVFAAIMFLSRVKLNIDPGFDVHVFAKANAIINSLVTGLLIVGLVSVKQKRYYLHKRVMIFAMILSILFLASYIAHHLLAGETRFGDTDHDGILTMEEKSNAGKLRLVYYSLLGTHIPLAGIILPFILFTAYRSLTGEYERHKKLAKITWPIWLYVAISGVMVYLLISPYYD